MYSKELEDRKVERPDISTEPNRHIRAYEIHAKAVRDNWYPRKNRMTKQDHLDVITALEKVEQGKTLQVL